jgi:hypothetical protein
MHRLFYAPINYGVNVCRSHSRCIELIQLIFTFWVIEFLQGRVSIELVV